jgi:hypothetical protein
MVFRLFPLLILLSLPATPVRADEATERPADAERIVTVALDAPSEHGLTELHLAPQRIRLSGDARQQQIVLVGEDGRRSHDLTRKVNYESADPQVATVDEQGLVTARGAGETSIRITFSGIQQEIPVEVSDPAQRSPIDFEGDIQPVLTRFGCNSGPCHGKQRGQNGFQLSLLGFDSDFDFAALTKESRQRRVSLTRPEQSLLLTKPTGIEPHGGGVRIEKGGEEYQLLLDWIRTGAPRSAPDTPELVDVTVFPAGGILDHKAEQQLLVTAHFSDGTVQDVTRMATYQSNEGPIADIDDGGLVTAGTITGEAAIMARYQGQFALYSASVPLPGEVDPEYYESLPVRNFIDEHAWQALQRLGLHASDPAPDHNFLRRAYVDVIGRLPTADEARAFLDDTSEDKRDRLIDHLLEQPEYAEHWANKWADLLRPNPYRVGIKATLNYDAWIREAFRKNRPYDQFVSELVTATGSTFRDGNVTLFRDRRSPDEIITIVSQLFLGIRLECAKCHQHPFEVYGQKDFYSLAAYFAKLGRKGRGISPPISGSEEFLFTSTSGSVQHPLTGETLEPAPLFGTAPEVAEGEDPRIAFAAWMTSTENHYFAQTMANRVWSDLMGRGLVEPVDDLRATNPPTNGPLLEALGRDFAENGYDIKHLIRRIATSHLYGLSSEPKERNLVDTRYYSRYYRQRLRGEVLLDAIAQITGIPESFDAMPPDSSAKELWTHRIGSLFLDAFGRPDPNQDPPCERVTDPTVVQTLHLMNAENLFQKVTSDKGRAAELASAELEPERIVEELYLSVYSRRPTPDELDIGVSLYNNEESSLRESVEDLMWALMNTPEFVLKD